MSGKDRVEDYSAEEIHALLQQIRTEQEMRQNSPPAPGDPATTDAKPSAATSNASKKLQSDSELGVSQELSVEQMLDKIRREIAEEQGAAARDNRRADLRPVQRLRWRS